MKTHKDIGDLLREKIDSSQESLQTPLWERIKKTVVQNNRRRALFDWSLNGLILLFSILGIYTITTTLVPNKEISNTTTETQNTVINTTESLENIPSVSKENQAIVGKEKGSAQVQPAVQKEWVTEFSKKEKALPNKTRPTSTSVTTATEDYKQEEITVENSVQRTEKVYYYYNSKDGQEVMTKDKKVIDSVMQANNTRTDSLK